MNDLVPHSGKDIDRYRNDREIVRKTALQIIKDFNRFGIEVQFPDDLRLAYTDLFAQLSPIIRDLLTSSHTTLYSLLYTIDLNEHSVAKGITEMQDMEMYEVISHLLLERELKKVITREYFSRNK